MKYKGKFLRHAECPKCGSKDNLAIYEHKESCFTPECGYYRWYDTEVEQFSSRPRAIEMTGTINAIRDRRISEETCHKFKVTQADGKHYYPYYDSEGNLMGSKVRNVETKDFYSTGTQTPKMFGQNLFKEGGKYLTITEGELDALAVSQMFDNKYAVVSLKNGAGGAKNDVKANLEWIESFENVILCFDNDDAGRKATNDILPLFSHNKAKVCILPLKDASDMLKAGRIKDFISQWWNSKPYKPVGIISLSDEDMWDAFVKRGTEDVTPFPESFGALNAMLNGGIASGEVTVIGALTSIGKTTMIYNLLYGMMQESNKKIGAVFLESDKGETVEKLLSIHTETNISNIPVKDRDYVAYHEFYEDLAKDDKIHILDHQGSSDVDELFSKMRYMVKGLDCDVVILDPLQAAVTSNENHMIDTFMDRCLKLAKETGVSIIIVSHMNKPNNNDPHAVTEYNTKGSGSINQIAFNTILLSRDKMAEDDYVRNLTKIQLVKCRRTGRTGVAGWMYYDVDTTKMVQGEEPKVHEALSMDMEF